MDPTTVATTAVTMLAPYVVKAGEKAAEKIGETLPVGVGKVWKAITGKFKGKPAAEEAITDLVATPGDQLTQSMFAGHLRKALEADPTFLTELAQLLASVQQDSGDKSLNTGSGTIVTRGGVGAGAGGVAAQTIHGNVTIGGAKEKG